MALCKLHNYCIDRRLLLLDTNDLVPPPLASDTADIAIQGGVPLEPRADGLNDLSPEQLLHGGEHFDDINRALLRQLQRQDMNGNDVVLPRDILHDSVVEQGLTRPRISP
jgi:hypothetical protein